jgi:hypothetical protein
MKQKSWAAFVILLCLALGYALPAAAQTGGKATPAINQSFASKEISPGQTWKIYLKAASPNGPMKNIFAEVHQPGMGPYPLSIIRIKKENQKELSGYIYLPISNPTTNLESLNITLTVHVQDTSGSFGPPAVFPLFINSRSTQEAPPPGIFKEQALGPVMIMLRTPDGGASDSFL